MPTIKGDNTYSKNYYNKTIYFKYQTGAFL